MSPTRATASAPRKPLILIVDDIPDIRSGDGFPTSPCDPDALAGEIRRVRRGWCRSQLISATPARA